MSDLYGLLGLTKTASAVEIKRAYRKMAKTMHPDVGGNPEKWAEITAAYNVLSDDEKRAHYDATGEAPGIKPMDPRRMEMLQMLNSVVAAAMFDIENPAIDNLLGAVRKRIKEGKQQISEQKAMAVKKRPLMQDMLKRVTSKTEDNVVGAIISRHIEEIDRQIARADVMLTAFDDGMELLKGYNYEFTKLIADADALAMQSYMYPHSFKIFGGR